MFERASSKSHPCSARRAERKARKLGKLVSLKRNGVAAKTEHQLMSKRHFFGFDKKPSSLREDDVFINILGSMEIVDVFKNDGRKLLDSNGNLVFLLLPREVVLGRWCRNIRKHIKVRCTCLLLLHLTDVCFLHGCFVDSSGGREALRVEQCSREKRIVQGTCPRRGQFQVCRRWRHSKEVRPWCGRK